MAIPLAFSAGEDPDQKAEPAAERTETEPDDLDGDGLPDDVDPDRYSAENVGAEDDDGYSEEFDDVEPVQTTVSLNEGAKDDGLGFKALSIEPVDVVPAGSDIGSPVYPPPNGKLYKAVVEIKNYGQSAVDPFCADGSAALLDETDRNYEPKDTLDLNEWVCLDGVAPGFSAQATLAFKVPRGFRLGGLVLWNSDSSDIDGAESNIAVIP